ncbi:MAG: hypothetical protein JOZ73_00040 [Solirubrobacterales bacterium]|nr:hypothetical protein [Solirubrobacterales bacterium]
MRALLAVLPAARRAVLAVDLPLPFGALRVLAPLGLLRALVDLPFRVFAPLVLRALAFFVLRPFALLPLRAVVRFVLREAAPFPLRAVVPFALLALEPLLLRAVPLELPPLAPLPLRALEPFALRAVAPLPFRALAPLAFRALAPLPLPALAPLPFRALAPRDVPLLALLAEPVRAVLRAAPPLCVFLLPTFAPLALVEAPPRRGFAFEVDFAFAEAERCRVWPLRRVVAVLAMSAT